MKSTPATLLTAALVVAGCSGPEPSEPKSRTDWPMYRGDLAGTGASSLGLLTRDNVSQLTETWRVSLLAAETDASGAKVERRGAFSQVTPVVIENTMFVPTADAVIATDATTGQEIWRHGVGGRPSRRGVAYWPGEDGFQPRVLFTSGARLVAVDAASGVTVQDFGEDGTVDMGVPYNSVPLIFEHFVVVGANTPRGQSGGIGNARAFDARTGAKLWEFSSVPQPGGVGHDTWAGASWKGRVGVNAWPFYFTVDEPRGLLFLPLAAPVPWAWGGDREGANLFANSVVAVDVRTGAYVWHFQTIHHDIWDHDPPAPPVLFDIEKDGGVVSALAVTTKSGYLYILDRETGDPVFGVEERPMPASTVPGEKTFPTQPIPVTPPALARVSFTTSDLVSADDTSEEHAAACSARLAALGEIDNQGPFTPWAYRNENTTSPTTLLFPGLAGGHNWGGVAFDPNTRLLLAFSQDVGTLGWVEDAGADSEVPYVLGLAKPASFDVEINGQRWPCQKPPWGRLTAVDATTGTIAWQKPVGVSAGLPAERANTGRPGRASAIVTAGGLAFIAATDDNQLRALDIATGEQLWATDLGAHGNANPMTYLAADGHQHLAITATDEVIVYRLP